MNNVNMNKYDAAQTMNASTSSKLSMDYQQTANNQSSVRTGTEISNKDIDENVHKSSTWITDSQTGKTYEVNGTFDQTSGGWTGSGTINEYDKNGNYVGSYKGEISGTGNMSDYQKDVVQGGQGGRENAFQAVSVVSTNLDASNVTKNNIINENNKIDQNNNIKKAKTVDDASTTEDSSHKVVKGQKLALGDEITGHGGALGILKEGYSKFIGNSEDANIAKDAFLNSMTQNQNAILSQSGSNMTAKEFIGGLRSSISASVGGEIFGGTGLKATAEASYQFALKQNGGNATVADFNRIMNEEILNNVNQQVAFGKIKAEDYNKALEQAYSAYNNVLKDIAGNTGQISFPDTDPTKMPTNPTKR